MYYGKKKLGWRIIGLLVTAGLIVLPAGSRAVAAEAAWTQTSRADFEAGTGVHLDISSSPGDVKLGITSVSYLYALRGNEQQDFWRYNLSENTWIPLAVTPDKVKGGGSLAYDGGNFIYAFHGNNSNDFWRYSLSADSWAVVAGAPGAVGEGGALTYGRGYIYALRGNNSRDFWRYNVATNSWETRASTQDNILDGGALTSDGGNYIYAFHGETTETFWRYDIAADNWTSMANTPKLVGYGAALSYDDNRYIYALRGDGTRDFWRYDTSSDTWVVKADTPGDVERGGSLACVSGGRIYALQGDCSQQCWSYTIAADEWKCSASTPASVYDGGTLTRGAATYYASGNLTSSTRDTIFSPDFGNISWTATVPPGTEIQFQIAANNDNATWDFKGPDGSGDTYYTSSGNTVWAGHISNRYVKYKAFFSTADTGVTPVLHDVTITYSRLVVLPAAATGEAAPVEETTATFYGTVIDDGGESCQYRFQYGTTAGNYTADTGWIGSVTTGESFSMAIAGLDKGAKYHFRAQVKNSVGTGSGPEVSLLTKPDAPVEGSFKATAVNNVQIKLNWVKGEGAQRTMVRRSTTDYPAGIDDGVLVYFDTGTVVIDTGLTSETTYYYSAWSEVTGSQQWSDGSTSATATTSAESPVAVGGVVFKVNKAAVLAPWLGLLILLLAVCGLTIMWWKKVRT